MQFGDDFAQERGVGGMDGARDLFDKFLTDLALIIPHRVTVEHRCIGRLRNVHIVGHVAPRRFDRKRELVCCRRTHYPMDNAQCKTKMRPRRCLLSR